MHNSHVKTVIIGRDVSTWLLRDTHEKAEAEAARLTLRDRAHQYFEFVDYIVALAHKAKHITRTFGGMRHGGS